MVSKAPDAKPARRRFAKTRAGDVFEIPVPDGRRGYGQVIVAGTVLYVVVFRDLFDQPQDPSVLLDKDLLLVGWTLDALIHHGDWRIVGRMSPMAGRVPFPNYKVRIKGVPYVHDFYGKNYRLAHEKEWDLLENKTTVAPIRYQKALLAHHGLEEWREDYQSLLVEHARRRVLNNCKEQEDVQKH